MPISNSPAELFLEHKGTKVFRVYHNNKLDDPCRYLFTTNPNIADDRELSPCIFDVRKFVDIASLAPPLLAERDARRLGMELSTFQLTPAYLELKSRWQTWWDVDEPALINASIITAIEEGKVTT